MNRYRRAVLGCAFVVLSASSLAAVPIDVVVPANCAQPVGRKTYTVGLDLPAPVKFLTTENKGPVPKTAEVNGTEYGAAGDNWLAVNTASVRLSSGLTSGNVKTQFSIDEALFCSGTQSLIVSYLMDGEEPLTVRATYKAGETTTFVVGAAGLQEVYRLVGQKHSRLLSGLFGLKQSWFQNYQSALGLVALQSDFAKQYCAGCTWKEIQHFAYAMTLFNERLPANQFNDNPFVLLTNPAIRVIFDTEPLPPSEDAKALREMVDRIQNAYRAGAFSAHNPWPLKPATSQMPYIDFGLPQKKATATSTNSPFNPFKSQSYLERTGSPRMRLVFDVDKSSSILFTTKGLLVNDSLNIEEIVVLGKRIYP